MSPIIWIGIGILLFIILLITAQWFRDMVGEIVSGVFQMMKKVIIGVVVTLCVVGIIYFLWMRFGQ